MGNFLDCIDSNKHTQTGETTPLNDNHFEFNTITQHNLQTIFTNPKSKCNKSQTDTPITKRCSHTNRLRAALSYFETLKKPTTNMTNDQKSQFIEFNENVYKSVLEDIAHLIKEHQSDIKQIHSEWTEIYGLRKCSVSECFQTERHYNRGNRNRNKLSKNTEDGDGRDALYSFYESLYDRIHYFIYHLYDVGMRVDVTSLNLNQEEEDDEKDVRSQGVEIDKSFAERREHIMSLRKKLKLDSGRMETANNKFTIQSAETKHRITLMDVLIGKMNEKKIDTFLEENAFDSDAVEMDLEDAADSNVSALIRSASLAESLANFIHSVILRRGAFSTGFNFEYQKEKIWEDASMVVEPKYRNLKEEIIESGFLKHSEWMEFVVLKGTKYFEMEMVRKMVDTQKNPIPLTKEHLFVIILYCDFSALCTAFSATFRRKNVFESVESVKVRHSGYVFFGKLLEEMVWRFGISRFLGNGSQDGESGPFYCGINCVLNIGSFAITLKGPCSTSTVATVAMNFAKGDGIILKLDNDTNGADIQKFFDCSWISNYVEEAERLWISGYKPLRIVSILIVRTAKNYRNILRSLYLFDAMISGVSQSLYHRKKVDESDYNLLRDLINWTLKKGKKEEVQHKMDSYLSNEWNLFLQNKEEIILTLFRIDQDYKSLWKLVMFNVVSNALNESANGKDNVLRPEWISMFPLLRNVTIHTMHNNHKFRLEAMLETMKMIPSSVTVIICDGGAWIESVLTEEIRIEYNAAGWDIEYDEGDKKLVISKAVE